MRMAIRSLWKRFAQKHPGAAQFLMFFLLSNGITLLQMALMPLFKAVLGMTDMVNTGFQVGQLGHNFDGTPYYIFNYAAGPLSEGGGGGFAYFIAVQATMAIAQIINFFAQRKVTFKAKGGLAKAAFWYFIAYVVITVGAAAAQGLYKAPIYELFISTWGMGALGETLADLITMIINCAISFWVFFPIFKIIFREKPREKTA